MITRHKDIRVACSREDAKDVMQRIRGHISKLEEWKVDEKWMAATVEDDFYKEGCFLIVCQVNGNKPTAGVVIAYFDDEGQDSGAISIPNIVPAIETFLSVEQYNEIFDAFWSEVAKGCFSGQRVVHVGGAIKPCDLMGSRTWEAFEQFDALANRSGLHPFDEDRWRHFVVLASMGKSPLHEEDVESILREKGWPELKIAELTRRYGYEMELLRYCRKHRI